MLQLAWNTFRDRWQVFVGAIVTVCLGVALVQSSLLTLISAATAPIPSELPEAEALALREAYEGILVLLSMVLALAVFVAVFIVSSTFSFTVSQRRRDLALLRLTGASRKQVRSLLVGEALLLGLIGSALGVAVGIPVMRLQLWMLVTLDFSPPGFESQWRSWIVLVSFGTGVLIAVLGVLAASRRASQIRPMEALRESGQAAGVMTLSRWVAGLLFTAGAAILFLIFPAGNGEEPVWFIQLTPFLVTAPLIVGFAALAPLMVPLVSQLFGLVFRSQLSELALSNLRIDAQRSASTAAPIMVLFAFVVGISVTLDSISEADRQETLRTVNGDLMVTADQPAGSELASVEGVEQVSEETTVLFEVRFSMHGEVWHEPHHGMVADPATYSQTRDQEATDGDLSDLNGPAVAVSPNSWERDWEVGDTLQIRLDGEETEVEVVALLPQTLSEPYFLLPPQLAPSDAGPWQHIVQLADGTDESEVTTQLGEFGSVGTIEQWVSEAASEEERLTLNILIVLLGMTMLYTVIAMINAVVIAASDRRREFASARVTGLSRSQVVRVAFWESQAVVVIGLILGGLAAAASILGTSIAVHNLVGISVVSIQWPLVIALALGAAVVVGVTSVFTALTATSTPPIRLVASRE